MKSNILKIEKTEDLSDDISSENQDIDLKLHKDFPNGVELKNLNERPLARYFYAIKNQKDFFYLGKNYLEDFKQGLKSFAFYSESNKCNAQKIIMALAGYFDHVKKMNIAIISNQLEGEIAQIKRFSDAKTVTIALGPEQKMVVDRYHDHIDTIKLDSIFELAPMGFSNHEYERAVTGLMNNYDLVLWLVPDLSYIAKKTNIFFPVAHYIDSYSVIVREGETKSESLKAIQKVFAGYEIEFKGAILDSF